MPDYTLSNDDAERERLVRQAALIRPVTERLFRAAGIGPGMSVLDVGCGAGDVSALAAELVGPTGTVVGIDRDEAQVAACKQRWASLAHVTFQAGDLTDPPDGAFDAVVGRLVLMYQPDPAAAVAALAERLRPGGVMAFVETALRTDASPAVQWPERGPVGLQVQTWIRTGFASTGTQPYLGLRLPSLLRAAGLTVEPPYETASLLYEGQEATAMTVELLRAMVSKLVEAGIPAEQIDIDTLPSRLADEQGPDTVVVVGPLIGVWGRK